MQPKRQLGAQTAEPWHTMVRVPHDRCSGTEGSDAKCRRGKSQQLHGWIDKDRRPGPKRLIQTCRCGTIITIRRRPPNASVVPSTPSTPPTPPTKTLFHRRHGSTAMPHMSLFNQASSHRFIVPTTISPRLSKRHAIKEKVMKYP
jgi:hypothetical protein